MSSKGNHSARLTRLRLIGYVCSLIGIVGGGLIVFVVRVLGMQEHSTLFQFLYWAAIGFVLLAFGGWFGLFLAHLEKHKNRSDED